MRLGGALILGCLVAASATPCAAFADSDDRSQSMFSSTAILGRGNGQMLLKADRIDYDLNSAVSTAAGDVEIDYNGRILLADRVVNVSLLEFDALLLGNS